MCRTEQEATLLLTDIISKTSQKKQRPVFPNVSFTSAGMLFQLEADIFISQQATGRFVAFC